MNPAKSRLMTALTQRMGYLAQRQTVIAQNVANADTPGYQPKDVKPIPFEKVLKAQDMRGPRVTQANHIAPEPRHAAGRAKGEAQKTTYETSISGNAVVLEEQMMKVAEIQSEYNLATNLYRKHLAMLKTALGRPGGV
ncbi:MAG: flagellar basal body rod protein FlgB [Alphaproteobacteria bacterium]